MAEIIQAKVYKNKYVLFFGFILISLLAAAGILLCFLRGFDNMDPQWVFNLGVDILGIAICAVLYYSCLKDSSGIGDHTVLFIALLIANAAALFLDECAWIVQGVPSLRVWNRIVNAFFYANSSVIIYLFWRYVTNALDMENRVMYIANMVLNILLVPDLLLRLANIFVPIYFSVDEAGFYRRGEHYVLSLIYLMIVVLVVVIGLIRSRAPRREKTVAISFITIPLINQALTGWSFGISTQYAATLLSIVLIYGILFADRGKSLAATERELNTASGIQLHMLPSIFPAFPERSDFDIYATMNPAKEVGGDFYDFFLIDDDHLGLVMADVSGKGIPAALFMMATKILFQNYAMSGRSPAEILTIVNEQICTNNQEEMFVTVWPGILDLKTGKLTASNAGHEYPAIRRADGSFELFRDKHGFVAGGMPAMRYKNYELQLNPGDELFLYTDGVPEAANTAEQLYGTDRMLSALNSAGSDDPQDILESVKLDVDRYVGEAPQFDDLTMMCLRYQGGSSEGAALPTPAVPADGQERTSEI